MRQRERSFLSNFALLCSVLFCLLSYSALAAVTVDSWLTTEDLKSKSRYRGLIFGNSASGNTPMITLEEGKAYQTILGLGSSLEASSCFNLTRMTSKDRAEVMQRLFRRESGLGMNLVRICMGSSDFTGDPWYSYCDLLPGQKDPNLERFSIEKDLRYILPIIRQACQINPNILFFASSWSPPGWMKSSGNMTGGKLLKEFYPAYAQYFVKFIQSYQAEGIPIYAVTVQNEPGVDRALEKDIRWYYPSCKWDPEDERDFIRDHLGPALRKAKLPTKIWCYDHNYNEKPGKEGDARGISYPITILQDSKAAVYVDGVGFHGYEGNASGMSKFHETFPEKPIYFTEGSVFTIWGAGDLVDRFRNWASSYNAWVTMLDSKGLPNNGPFAASKTVVNLSAATLKPVYGFEYYMYGHFMKYIPRGARRVESTSSKELPRNVAFSDQGKTFTLITVNTEKVPITYSVGFRGMVFKDQLPAKALITYQWTID